MAMAATSKDEIKTLTTHYIDGAFVESHGREVIDTVKPTNGKVIALVTLADEEDTRRAIDAAKRAIVNAMRAVTVGDPADPKIAVGPMVSQKQYERVQSYIRKGIEEGAEVLVGGEGHPQGLEAGYFVKPTVFVNVKNDMTIAREEIFGPVLSVIAYDTEDDAVAIANDSRYGLHAAVLGTDLARARRVASRLRTGRVVINGMTDDPQAPWGGFKYSGVGREYGRYGIEAYLETRAILEG
jgi:aldehyde dehydrogenase (NAD+)